MSLRSIEAFKVHSVNVTPLSRPCGLPTALGIKMHTRPSPVCSVWLLPASLTSSGATASPNPSAGRWFCLVSRDPMLSSTSRPVCVMLLLPSRREGGRRECELGALILSGCDLQQIPRSPQCDRQRLESQSHGPTSATVRDSAGLGCCLLPPIFTLIRHHCPQSPVNRRVEGSNIKASAHPQGR